MVLTDCKLCKQLENLTRHMKCDLINKCKTCDIVRGGVCKATSDECSLLRDLEFVNLTEGYGYLYEEERELFKAWREVYHQ